VPAAIPGIRCRLKNRRDQRGWAWRILERRADVRFYDSGNGRIVVEPTRHPDHDRNYIEQLGPLRDQRDQPWKAPDHVTKDAQIEAPTAEVSELHEWATKLHTKVRTRVATHTREMNQKEAQLKTINGKLMASER
jgi:hypothetical protein